MAWSEAARTQHGRPHDDLADALRGPGAGAGMAWTRRAFGTRCRQEDRGTEAAHRGGRGGQPDHGSRVHTSDVQGIPDVTVDITMVIMRRSATRGTPDVTVDILDKAGGLEGACRRRVQGDTPCDRLQELMLPDIPEIVGKQKETAGFEIIPRRRVVERTFAGTGRCRRRTKDFERSPENSLARVQHRLPLPHVQGRARDKGLIHKNMMISMTCDSGSEALIHLPTYRHPSRIIASA